MNVVSGNLWSFWENGAYIAVTTNGFVNNAGECVMGRGVAKQAAKRFPELPGLLGQGIARAGNRIMLFRRLRVIAFPTKHNWWEKSDPQLIKQSARQLVRLTTEMQLERVYLPWPGCNNGGLQKKHVSILIRPILDDRFTIVEYRPC